MCVRYVLFGGGRELSQSGQSNDNPVPFAYGNEERDGGNDEEEDEEEQEINNSIINDLKSITFSI